ncbi:VanZ family protein [Metallumcola ferriviriculae]|uniref:VanZ family protein n=1 Tax=Metallumcola ferriviriculae TaxID=3039180 RepID=A0AAU0UMG8_9FIRM|nr:VanZ family protein [Desulfitibacteraceae bacterium MK1]
MSNISDRITKKIFLSKTIRGIAIIVFVFYALVMLSELFLGGHRWYSSEFRYNLVPFKTISRYIVDYHRYNFNTWFINLFGNVLAFMPLGFLAPIIFHKKLPTIKNVFGLSLTIPFLIEIIQLVLRVGSFDIDDIILNSIGVMLGYLILIIVLKTIKKMLKSEYLHGYSVL